MPVLRINATENGLQVHDSNKSLCDALTDQARDASPIVIMVHGYKYAPHDAVHCPHTKIFRNGPGGWPARLGFSGERTDEGLCVAFGWHARGPLRQMYRRAQMLGEELAILIKHLRRSAPDRPVNVIAHSLGSEIALSALAHLEAHSIDRILLLTGASFSSTAREMLATQSGATSEVFNVTSRENDLFDLAFEHMIAPPRMQDRAIGQGIDAPNVLNLQLDCDRTLDAFEGLGFPVARPNRRICHWSAYTRPGVMALYEQLFRNRETLTQNRLAALLPDVPAPRWSRFLAPARGQRDVKWVRHGLSASPLALKLKNRIMAVTTAQGKDNEHAY